MSDLRFVEQADPGEVFAVLADDTRIAILQALWENDDGVTFSELREAVGMRDSGQFNYHLGKLVGPFVSKTDDGYELTQAGMAINGAIRAGAYTMEGTIEPIDLDTPCPTCGGERTLHYEDETVQVDCDSCPVSYRFGVPPAAFAGYDRAAIPRVASRYLRTTFQHIDSGFCWFCDGRTEPHVGPIGEINPAAEDPPEDVPDDLADRVGDVPLIEFECQRCGATPTAGLYLTLLDHPAVVGLFYDHGIDVRERPIWEFAELNPDGQAIRSRDPFRASVTYRVEDDAVTLVVDENLDVVEVET